MNRVAGPGWIFVSTLLILSLAIPVHATVVGGAAAGPVGAKFIKLRLPLSNPRGPSNSVGNDNFDQPNLYAFDEDQNIRVPKDLEAEVGRNPVKAGSTVASHYVFFDPGPAQEIIGTVDFDAPVVAIMTSTGTLAASDFLAKTGVHYLSPSARGLESGDYVTISGPKQILFHTVASSPGDYVRVLTEFSPGAPVRITSLDLEAAPEPVMEARAMLNFNGVVTSVNRNCSALSANPRRSDHTGIQEYYQPGIDSRRTLRKPG
jgi:hypothetical protein